MAGIDLLLEISPFVIMEKKEEEGGKQQRVVYDLISFLIN